MFRIGCENNSLKSWIELSIKTKVKFSQQKIKVNSDKMQSAYFCTCTVCPSSLVPFYILRNYIRWVKTSWTCGILWCTLGVDVGSVEESFNLHC